MSPEAQYDSVFKSRPKIALSPVMSPQAETDIDMPVVDGVEVDDMSAY